MAKAKCQLCNKNEIKTERTLMEYNHSRGHISLLYLCEDCTKEIENNLPTCILPKEKGGEIKWKYPTN